MDYKDLYEKKCQDYDLLIQQLNKLEITCNDKTRNDVITDKSLWNKLKQSNLTDMQNKIKYLLNEFGTFNACNRFDIGNSIEFIISDHLKSLDIDVIELPNAKKIDICLNNNYKLSIKYSSTGNITLHNSNGQTNKDCEFTDMLLITPSKIYLITNKILKKLKIDIKTYLINCGDSLKLNRKLLKHLESVSFPYQLNIDINVNKKECKNRLCSKLFYKMTMIEYTKNKTN